MALSAPLMTRKRVVQVKVETTKGTAESSGLTDMFCFDPVIEETSEFNARKGTAKYMGQTAKGTFGPRTGTFTCRAELRGNGTNAMDPGISALLQACGLKNTSESYAPTSTHSDQKAATIIVFEDGLKKVLYGAAGTFRLDGEIGKHLYIEFEFQGKYAAPTDAALPEFDPNDETPARLASGTFTLASNAIKIGKVGFDAGNDIQMRADITDATGIGYFYIADREPLFSLDPEADLVAGYDYHGVMAAGTETALSLILGTGAGKRITIAAGKLQYRQLTEGDRNGVMIYDLNAQCNATSGDDEYTIAVTTA